MSTVLLLALVAALLAALGGYLLRDAPLRRVRHRGERVPDGAGDAQVLRAFEVLGQATLERGNKIELLANGEELFPRLFADLRRAEDLITWQVYWFKPGALADRIADALLERARAGVEVLMLLDAFGAQGLPDAYMERLRAGGVNVQKYRPLAWRGLYKLPHRSHVRSVVIDSRVGYTGGFGIDNRWQGNGREPGQWRDTHVRVEGPAVDQLQAPFIANWGECTGELLLGAGVMEAAQVAGDDSHRAAVMYASPSLGSTNAERFVALTITSARRSLYITSAYFVPGRGFRNQLCDAAKRGVDVRILTPGANTDRRSAWYAGRAHYQELLESGVRLFEYAPTMVHAKTFVADGCWISVGSINLDNRSLKLNDEVSLVARDEALGRAMEALFMQDLRFSQEVMLADFERRPSSARVRERAALLVAPVL